MMMQGSKSKPQALARDDIDDESLVISALKLSDELQLGTFEKCYQALKISKGNEDRAIEELLK